MRPGIAHLPGNQAALVTDTPLAVLVAHLGTISPGVVTCPGRLLLGVNPSREAETNENKECRTKCLCAHARKYTRVVYEVTSFLLINHSSNAVSIARVVSMSLLP